MYRTCAAGSPPGPIVLTSYVGFSAEVVAGIDAGLYLIGYTTLAQFLINAGITALLERLGLLHGDCCHTL